MASIIVTANVTTLQSLNTGDFFYLAPGASILRTANSIESATASATNAKVIIDGTVVSLAGSAAISLTGTFGAGGASATGGHQVVIGTSGIVRASNSAKGVDTRGGQNIVTNNGEVESSSDGIFNVGAQYRHINTGLVTAAANGVRVIGDAANITNAGRIASYFSAALDIDGDAGTIQNSGQLTGKIGVSTFGDGNRLLNAGQISGFRAVAMFGDDNQFTNAVGGRIDGADIGLDLLGGLGTQRVTNAGSLTSGDVAVNVEATTTLLTNHGLIEAAGNIAIDVTRAAATLTLVNTGVLRATGATAVQGNTGVETIRNSGTIIGDLRLGDGADRVTNTGIVRGAVDMGAGADAASTLDGRVFGSITGGAGNDTLTGGSFGDVLIGGTENDLLLGGAGDDTLQGGAGADRINGGLGNDRIIAGIGADVLSGEAGADVFEFVSKATLGIGAGRDQITDFTPGVDDLEMIFMNAFIGNAAFTAAGQVRYVQATGLLTGSTDGDASAEWALLLVNKPVVTAVDFVF